MEALLIIWIVCGIAALFIGQGSARFYLGMTFGLPAFLLGPFALFIALFSGGRSRPQRKWD